MATLETRKWHDQSGSSNRLFVIQRFTEGEVRYEKGKSFDLELERLFEKVKLKSVISGLYDGIDSEYLAPPIRTLIDNAKSAQKWLTIYFKKYFCIKTVLFERQLEVLLPLD